MTETYKDGGVPLLLGSKLYAQFFMQLSVACNLIPLGDRLDSDPTVDFLDKDAVRHSPRPHGRPEKSKQSRTTSVQTVEPHGSSRQHTTDQPLAPPQQGQKQPYRGKDGDEGQNLHQPVVASATKTALGAEQLDGSRDPRAPTASSSSAPPQETSPRW